MAGAAYDLLPSVYRDPSSNQIALYVHSGTGNDNNDGTSGHPLRTTREALGRIPMLMWGRRATVNYLSGHSETLTSLIFPPCLSAGNVDNVALDGSEPAWDYIRAQIQLQAVPTTVDTLNGTLGIAEATSGLVSVTDVTKNWTPGEHVGRALINPGAIAETGMIFANTNNTLSVASVGYSDGTLAIVDRNATLTLGDPSSFTPAGLMMSAQLAFIAFVNLNIRAPSGASPALDLSCPGKLAFLNCEISGGVNFRGGLGELTMDACYLHGGFLGVNSGIVAVRQSYVSNMTTNFHAVSGQYDLYGSKIQGCGSMGHGGTQTPHGGFRIDNCWFSNSTSHGVQYLGGSRSRVTATRIDSSAGSAIYSEGTGTLLVQSVTGSGSTNYGCFIDNGANVNPNGTVTVTGASGDVRLGGTGGVTYTWAQAPQVNTSRLCRFGL